MRTAEYLKRFFEEKDLEPRMYEVQDSTGMAHMIPSEVVIETIHGAPLAEQKQIVDVLRKIDFLNGDVHGFLKHLAKALANQKSPGAGAGS